MRDDKGLYAIGSGGTLALGALAALESETKTHAKASGARQVVSTLKTDSFSTTSTTFVDVTGVSVTITPSSASSTVLVIVSGVVGSNATDNFTPINLLRGSTNIAQSTGSTNFNQTLAPHITSTSLTQPFSIVFLDSPATTSATTYKIQLRSNNNPLAYIGRMATFLICTRLLFQYLTR